MLISIIIPCYNSARTIADTIESALSQDVEREVIVIDDGSTDRSTGIIESFHDLIRAEHGPNRGVSAARNRGGELARGDLLQFVDSDDVLAPGTLAARCDAMMSCGADAVFTDYRQIIEAPDGSEQMVAVIEPPAELLQQDAEAACADSRFWVPPVAILYRREIVERAGGWRCDLPVIQDARLLFDVAAQSAKFVHVSGIGAHYRVRADGLSRRNRARFLQDCFLNAQQIEASWMARGVLTTTRVEVVRSLWWQAAVSSLTEGSADFEPARRNYNRTGGRRLALEAGWLLRKSLGRGLAGRLARTELRRRAALRAYSPPGH